MFFLVRFAPSVCAARVVEPLNLGNPGMPSGLMISPCVMTVPNSLQKVSNQQTVHMFISLKQTLCVKICFATICDTFIGNFCSLCDKCYDDDDDYNSKMMKCGRCNHWVHTKCENLTG